MLFFGGEKTAHDMFGHRRFGAAWMAAGLLCGCAEEEAERQPEGGSTGTTVTVTTGSEAPTTTGAGGGGGAGGFAAGGGGAGGSGGGGGEPGGPVWTKVANDSFAIESVMDLGATSDGGVALLVWMDGTTDFGGGPITSQGSDFAVVKYAADGTHLFTSVFAGPGDEVGLRLAVGPGDQLFITGTVSGPIDFGGGVETVDGASDAFLLALDPDGKYVWARLFGDDSPGEFDQGLDVAVSASGVVVVTGKFYGTMNLGGFELESNGSSDFIAAFDTATGTHVHSLVYDQSSGYQPALAVDDSGNVYVTGAFSQELSLGGLSSEGTTDAFLAKLGPMGTLEWAERFGYVGYTSGTAVGVDAQGNVVLVGTASDPVDLGGGLLGGAGSSNVFVARFDPAGNHLSSTMLPGAALGYAHDLEVLPDGHLLIGGALAGTLDFGTTQISAPPDAASPLWLLLDPASALVAGDTFPCTAEARINGVAFGPAQSVYFGGPYRGSLMVGGQTLPDSGFNSQAAFWGRAAIMP